MKLTKYLLLACTALIFTACGNDDDWNTDGGVTVEMANATMKVKENVGMINVPFKVTGETNGPIRVTVDVTEVAASPAVADQHYIMTSKTVVIPADDHNVALEITLTNDMDINDDRMFTISIVNVQGATVGAQATTEVTIADDDSLFYEALQGTWTFADTNFFDDSAETYSMKFVGVGEGEEGYEEILYLQGFAGKSNLVAGVYYLYDEATNAVTLEIPYGQALGQLNFTGLGVCDVVLCGVNGTSIATTGSAVATVSADLRSISFDPDDVFYLAVFSADGTYQGGFDGYMEMSMSR